MKTWSYAPCLYLIQKKQTTLHQTGSKLFSTEDIGWLWVIISGISRASAVQLLKSNLPILYRWPDCVYIWLSFLLWFSLSLSLFHWYLFFFFFFFKCCRCELVLCVSLQYMLATSIHFLGTLLPLQDHPCFSSFKLSLQTLALIILTPLIQSCLKHSEKKKENQMTLFVISDQTGVAFPLNSSLSQFTQRLSLQLRLGTWKEDFVFPLWCVGSTRTH